MVNQLEVAKSVLVECGVPEAELRQQWRLQKEAQLSLRARKFTIPFSVCVLLIRIDAPARLKNELEEILSLQAEVDGIETSIQKAKTAVKISQRQTKATTSLIANLSSTQEVLKSQVDELYISLNIVGEYPQLTKIGLPFLRQLLLARDLKISIRKKAVGSFFEWERLDRAVGGHHLPLGAFSNFLITCLLTIPTGTKLHQVTRKAIAKRKPALLRAISKYNNYCDTLDVLAPNNCPVPASSHRIECITRH